MCDSGRAQRAQCDQDEEGIPRRADDNHVRKLHGRICERLRALRSPCGSGDEVAVTRG
jgi:hypothetical protein